MDSKRDNNAPVADDQPNTTPILTPRLTNEEADIVATYCGMFGAMKGRSILTLGVAAMQEAIQRQQMHAA